MSRKYDPQVFVALATAHPTWSNVSIARHLGVDEATVRRGLRAADYQRHLLPEDMGETIVLDRPIHLVGPATVTADWHVNLTDYALANAVIRRSRERGITTLVIGGDFFNFDSLSQWDPKQETAGLERELVEGIATMRVLLETFEKIVYIWGNHDARLHKSLGYKMQFDNAMRMVFGALGSDLLQRVEFSNLDHCFIHPYEGAPKWESWMVCHPANYSSIPTSTARSLAAKEGCNVITAHSHHCALAYAPNGVHVAAEIGGLFDASKTAYLQRTTKFPNWQNGYGIVNEQNRLEMWSPGWQV